MQRFRESLSSSRAFFVPALFLLLLVMLALAFFYLLRQLDERQGAVSQYYFLEVVTRTAAATRATLMTSLHPLQESATTLSEQWPMDTEAVRALLQQQPLINKFKQAGVYFKDGRTIGATSETRLPKPAPTLFDDHRSDQGTIVETTVDSEDGLSINAFLVPVRHKDSVVAVVFATMDSSVLARHMDTALFGKLGGAFVMDSKGMGISLGFANSLRKNDLFDGMSKAAMMHPPLEEVRATLSKGIAGSASFYHRGSEFYVAFAPLGINDWFTVGFIPANIGTKNLHNTSLRINVALLIAGLLFLSMLAYILWLNSYQRQLHQKHVFRMETLAQCFPGSILRCRDDAPRTFLEYNKGFLDLLGFTADEIESQFNNQLLPMIYPPDRHMSIDIGNSAREELGHSSRLPLEYRMVCKDGTRIWVNEYSNLAHEGKETYWCIVLLDVSLRRNAIERRSVEEKRYRILFEMSEAILYEYDMRTGVLATTRQFFDKFGYPMPESLNSLHPIDLALLHPEDVTTFVSLNQALLDGENSAEALVRIQRHDGQWLWCHAQQTALLNSSQVCIKALGRITDVDAETRVLYQLREDMQRDPFTGLYNKVATAALVDDVLCQMEEAGDHDKVAALCIVDVDNFKCVNDRLGHEKGDEVLKSLSESLAAIFRQSDIVGRVGGDEFVVFIRDASKMKVLAHKMELVMESMRRTLYATNGEEFHLSASIGIALCPKDGWRYIQLYPRADRALYRSKITKNTCTYYSLHLDGK